MSYHYNWVHICLGLFLVILTGFLSINDNVYADEHDVIIPFGAYNPELNTPVVEDREGRRRNRPRVVGGQSEPYPACHDDIGKRFRPAGSTVSSAQPDLPKTFSKVNEQKMRDRLGTVLNKQHNAPMAPIWDGPEFAQ